jgi:hypothetical protein
MSTRRFATTLNLATGSCRVSTEDGDERKVGRAE